MRCVATFVVGAFMHIPGSGKLLIHHIRIVSSLSIDYSIDRRIGEVSEKEFNCVFNYREHKIINLNLKHAIMLLNGLLIQINKKKLKNFFWEHRT